MMQGSRYFDPPPEEEGIPAEPADPAAPLEPRCPAELRLNSRAPVS